MNTHLAILSLEHAYERVAFRVLFVLLGVALCGYLYFVGASVLNIIARKEAARTASSLESTIAVLEKEYFVLADSVTPAVAGSIGLAPIAETRYVYRPGNAAIADEAPDTIDRNAI